MKHFGHKTFCHRERIECKGKPYLQACWWCWWWWWLRMIMDGDSVGRTVTGYLCQLTGSHVISSKWKFPRYGFFWENYLIQLNDCLPKDNRNTHVHAGDIFPAVGKGQVTMRLSIQSIRAPVVFHEWHHNPAARLVDIHKVFLFLGPHLGFLFLYVPFPQIWVDGLRKITHNGKANNVCPMTALKKQ